MGTSNYTYAPQSSPQAALSGTAQDTAAGDRSTAPTQQATSQPHYSPASPMITSDHTQTSQFGAQGPLYSLEQEPASEDRYRRHIGTEEEKKDEE
jgi:hypothetical protein